jgi:DNA-binding response OmpR family regulator
MTRILLVDDEPKVRRIMQLALERPGYEVVTASNGEVALAELRSSLPDVLITDIEMPRMTGRALCEAIQKEFPGRTFPIFVITSLAEREHRVWTSEMRDIHFIEKPVSVRMLLAKLGACLGPQSVPAATT